MTMAVAGCFAGAASRAQNATAGYDATTHVFRLDGGGVTYAFGVNRRGELQTVYWGARLRANDPLSQPTPMARAFELTDTPQEFAGWGGGLTTEPSLKITFPDGNRDLVLHYQSHQVRGSEIDVVLKDIDRHPRAFRRGDQQDALTAGGGRDAGGLVEPAAIEHILAALSERTLGWRGPVADAAHVGGRDCAREPARVYRA